MTEGLADEEVDARLHRPADLLIEDPAHGATRGVIRRVDIGIREIAGEERVRLHRHLAGNRQRVTVERLEQVFLADEPKLLAMPVVGERLDDVRAGVDKLPMELRNHFGMLEDDLGNKGARLQVPTSFAFEQVALGADHDVCCETLQQPLLHTDVRFAHQP